MSKIAYTDKAAGSSFVHEDANEIKASVNSLYDDVLALDKSDVGLGNVDNTSDVNKPVSTAQQAAINAAVVGLYDDRGNYNASGNVYPSTGGSGTAGAILKGDIWTISVAGTLNGILLKVGDTIRALQDTPGQTDANWAIVQTGLTSAQITAIGLVTLPAVGTLTTGSNAINLTNIAGQEYHPYNMSSGNLTITVGANPVAGASAHFIKIGDGSHTFDSSAFTTLSGEDDNTLNVVTHVFISYKLNSSDTLAGFIQFVQQP